ncbi:MAG: hypothetical protein ACJ79H_20235, partial [Myxococcales bacterium]
FNAKYLMRTISPGYNGSESDAIITYMLGTIAANPQIENLFVPLNHFGGWPTYYGQSTDPTYTIVCSGAPCEVAAHPGHAPPGGEIQEGDPTPILANGFEPDRHLTFIDQSNGYEYDLWHVFFTGWPQTRSPLGGAGGQISTEGSGYTNAFGGDGRAIGDHTNEGNAGRVGNLAGRIRVEELNDAVAHVNGRTDLGHALAITVNCSSGKSVYPAFAENSGRPCHKISQDDTKAPPMGGRIFLDMTPAAIDQLAVPPKSVPEWKRVILRTLANYGAIIMDTGSDKYFTLQAESGNQYTSMAQPDAWLQFASCMYGDGVNCGALSSQTDWEKNSAGDYTGVFHQLKDGINWTTDVWSHLKILDECVSNGVCNP